MVKAVYIHIPFCKKICSYCDFPKMYCNSEWINKYLDSLEYEIKTRYSGEVIDTIYIGGGTPSVLNIKELTKLFDILKIFKTSKDIEFTFEINFDSITREKLLFLKKHKVNRLSFGIESLSKKNQKLINRYDSKEKIESIISMAKEIGFNNINVDLIYALPNESLDDVKKDIAFVLNLDISHISMYSLIVAPNTILYINKYTNVDETLEVEMYNYICKELKKHKYIHYEISNFAKKGMESKHNLTYWNNDEYYGFGLGAASYINEKRMLNTKSINKYIGHKYIIEVENIDDSTKMEYEIMLNLRKSVGIDKNLFLEKYNMDVKEVYDIENLIKNKILIEDNNNIYIPEDKWYVSNEIIVDIIRSKNG